MNNKEIRINFSAGDGAEFKFLVRYYVEGNLVNWEQVIGSDEIRKCFSDFYFTKEIK